MDIPNTSGTKCPKCGETHFELVKDFPSKGAFWMYYMRCSECKTFLQALPVYDTNGLLGTIQEDINKIKKKIGVY